MSSTDPRFFFTPIATGGVIDLALGLSWDSAAFRGEVTRRIATLSRMGVGRGSIVAIGHGGSARFFADLFAVWNVGAAAACLDPSLTPRELRTIVEFAKSDLLLVDRTSKIDDLPLTVVDLGSERASSSSVHINPPDPDDPALVLFTSGTTGAPKGVVLSFRALQMRINANFSAMGKESLARALVSLPTHFGHGLIGNSLTPLLAGGDIVLHPLGISLANDLGRIIDQHSITFMSSVPALWRMALTRSTEPAGASLMRVHVGSAPFSAKLWSEVAAWSRADVVNCYGTTETANWIAGASSRTDGAVDGLVGRMWGGKAAVMDESGSINRTGAGEIIVQSPSLMSGYLHRPDLTEAALKQDWYRTGDTGSIDQGGRIWLTGRIKDEINRAGFKVQPAEIDTLLESNAAIAEACVFGISDPLRGEAVAAAIRLEEGHSVSPQILEAWCLERVRREAIPERWFIVAEIPKTSRGKVSRDLVRRTMAERADADKTSFVLEPLTSGANENDVGSIGSAVKNAVELAWSEVLGRDSLIADISLNQTGGDSLDAMRMWLMIEQTLGMRVLMDVLESNPSPSQLIVALEQQVRAQDLSSSYTVFFMMPAEGDSPSLAHFRSLLNDRIKFVMIEYPNWRKMIAAGAGFEALVDAAVAQILLLSDEHGPCHLTGYSFGGLVAIEAARCLMERGHRIGFLGLIDTWISRPTETRQAQALSRPYRMLGKIMSALILMSALRPLNIIGRLARLLPAKHAFTIEFLLNTRLRTRSIRTLHLKPLRLDATLYRSDEGPLADNGWSAYFSQITVVPIGGDHHSILEPPFLNDLSAKFVDSLQALERDILSRNKSSVKKPK